ncbi:MAG TPA: site-specific integrase, partial [Candidatus Anammoximicrobium sp.]|nr:site-specific integrase [Candidatus Anammoximicrobium sp.]
MPRLSNSVPRYRKHRASGQAIVTLGGKDVYLGPHGTKASHREYDRVIAEWLENERTIPEPEAGLTVVELFAAYKRHAVKYYRKNGKVTTEVGCILQAAQFVKELYGRTEAAQFGPLALQ